LKDFSASGKPFSRSTARHCKKNLLYQPVLFISALLLMAIFVSACAKPVSSSTPSPALSTSYLPVSTANGFPNRDMDSGDNYYLSHSFEKSDSVHGAIYTSAYSSADLSELHTVIYGRNMKDKSMFAQLHSFEDAGFFNDNRTVKIYTTGGQFNYYIFYIFAAYETDDSDLLYGSDYGDRNFFAEYLQGIPGMAQGMNNNMTYADMVTAGDKIITLSTCISEKGDMRYII